MKTATNTTRLIERVYNYIMKLLTKYADIVTFTTESYSYSRCDKAKQYAIIPSGVDQKFFTSLNIRDFEETPRKILFVGQLQPYKGVDLLIEAGKGLNLAIYIAGKGDLFDFYKKKTRGIKNITMLGFVPDDVLLEWYAKAHFVVLPSISAAEAFGLVTLEGMAGGCVPITCDLPGVKDLSKTTGLVFACGDVSDLARKLSQAGDISIAELQKRSEASIAFARGYLWDRCVDLYAELYERVKHRNKA
jgi:glycosyltransferase involved in cell wall biosynthesis